MGWGPWMPETFSHVPLSHSVIWGTWIWPYLHLLIPAFFSLACLHCKDWKKIIHFPCLLSIQDWWGSTIWAIICLPVSILLFPWVGGSLSLRKRWQLQLAHRFPPTCLRVSTVEPLQLFYSHEWKAKRFPQMPALTSLRQEINANKNSLLPVFS